MRSGATGSRVAIALLIGAFALTVVPASAHTKKYKSSTDLAFGQSTISGEVTSSQAKCVKGRKVTLFRDGAAVGTDTTDANAVWSIAGYAPGEHAYFVKLAKRRIGPADHNHICLGVASNSFNVVAP